jgi:HK97 family phage major capsid protein
MDPELEKKLNEATGAVLEFRGRIDKIEASTGHVPADIKGAVDTALTAFATTCATKQDVEARDKRLDEIEKRFEILKNIQGESGIKPKVHREAIRDFIRSHGGRISPMPKFEAFAASDEYRTYQNSLFAIEETRTLTEGTAADGGLFLDPELDTEILKNYVAIDPIRSVADVRTIAGMEIKGYRRTGTPTAYHGNEMAGSTASQAAWAEYKIPVHPLYVITQVSEDLLSDVRFIESEIVADAGEAFGYTEGVDFLSGNSVDKAAGIFFNHGTDATKYPADVTGVGTAVISPDDIATMYTTLPVPYRPNCTWGFNSTVLKRICILKEATTNAYIWQPGLQAGPPDRIYGRPFIICESMTDQGNDYYPIMLGDFKKGYRIADRSGIVLLRDVFTGYPGVYFKMRKRVGGQVIKPEAIKILLTT